ncbi:MAG TPA: LamG-like jellyroll fold domain-containing protein, partial [Longimicrobium sp.]|nr:LamG-like jellyroll fold domain-containing protein [Longimicrobium sp.]
MSHGSIVVPPFNGYPVALWFDGAGAYVELKNPAALRVTGEITLQAWICPVSTTGTQYILAHGLTLKPRADVYLCIHEGRYQVGSWDGTEHLAEHEAPATDAGRWVHLCGTWDGTNWTLYRNGVQVAQSPSGTGAVSVPAGWAIGARGDGSERFFYGMIRNVALWSTARTAAQVAGDMYQPPGWGEAGLAGFWALDLGSGRVAADRSGGGSNGRLRGATWTVPRQRAPTTLVLPEKTTGHVALGNPAKLNFSGQVTLMAWVMPHVTTGCRNVLAHGYTVDPDAEVYLRIRDGFYQVGSWNGSDCSAGYAVPAGDVMQWVHLCGTWDGTNWTLYRNGVQVAQSPAATGAVTVPGDWAIGARGGGSERCADACIRGVAVWQRALSAAEVVQYIQEPIFGSESGLAAYWPLDEGAGPDVFDRTPNPANGTLAKAGWIYMPPPPGWFLATRAGAFSNMNLPVVLAAHGQLWAMAGQYRNAVYSSFDGAAWTTVTAAAPWTGRRGAAGVVFHGRLWLLGGETVTSAEHDVWWSDDGESWTRATEAAGWARRTGLCAEVFQGKIWVFGGRDGGGNVYNDVWYSADGKSWTCATTAAAWSPRDSAGSAVFGGCLWLFGGAYGGNSLQDAWSSDDGVTWTAATTPPWASRFGPNVEVLADTLYLMGGTNTQTRDLGDVWSTRDGSTWTQLYASAPWFPRSQQGTAVLD